MGDGPEAGVFHLPGIDRFEESLIDLGFLEPGKGFVFETFARSWIDDKIVWIHIVSRYKKDGYGTCYD